MRWWLKLKQWLQGTKHCCRNCGSEDVYEEVWIDRISWKVADAIPFDPVPVLRCRECGEYTCESFTVQEKLVLPGRVKFMYEEGSMGGRVLVDTDQTKLSVGSNGVYLGQVVGDDGRIRFHVLTWERTNPQE